MNIKRIFLDVDDTLVDLTLAVMEYLGIDRSRIDLDSFYERFGYDIVKATNYYREKTLPGQIVPYEPCEFWSKLPRPFWANLQKTNECDNLIEASYTLVGKRNVFLLTSPINDPECAAGKMELIRDTFPEFWSDRRYMIAPPKDVCAATGSLLIDDSDAHVDAFREAGGMAALLPKPWNSEHARSGQPLSFTKLL